MLKEINKNKTKTKFLFTYTVEHSDFDWGSIDSTPLEGVLIMVLFREFQIRM